MSFALPIIGGTPDPPPAPREARPDGTVRDSHGRRIRDLRLSITDRCNYRCVYCMDPDHRYLPKQALLSLEEYLLVTRACRRLGLEKIRVTGGEPTLWPELDELLGALGEMGWQDVAMTTNGSLTDAARARQWAALGLTRITFSLDSLRPERVGAITRSKATGREVADAIAAARAAGLGPLKVNAVVLRGVNDDEVADFADFAREHAVDFRLIEWMPLDSGRTWNKGAMVTAAEMLERLNARHDLVAEPRSEASETSLNYRFADGAPGRIGVIASVTRPFCGACSRLRITADGKVRPCLFSRDEFDLRPLLRRGTADEEQVAGYIADAVWTKQAGHGIGAADFIPPERGMSAIGG